jgi:hypothetical protein
MTSAVEKEKKTVQDKGCLGRACFWLHLSCHTQGRGDICLKDGI